jgi:hypothetical protein
MGEERWEMKGEGGKRGREKGKGGMEAGEGGVTKFINFIA